MCKGILEVSMEYYRYHTSWIMCDYVNCINYRLFCWRTEWGYIRYYFIGDSKWISIISVIYDVEKVSYSKCYSKEKRELSNILEINTPFMREQQELISMVYLWIVNENHLNSLLWTEIED